MWFVFKTFCASSDTLVLTWNQVYIKHYGFYEYQHCNCIYHVIFFKKFFWHYWSDFFTVRIMSTSNQSELYYLQYLSLWERHDLEKLLISLVI